MSADTDQYQLLPSLQINEYNRLKDDISENGVFHTFAFECVQNSSTEACKITVHSGEDEGDM